MSRRAGWRFRGTTPIWFKLIGGFLLADAVAHFALTSTVSMWAQTSPDAAHSHRVPFRDGSIYFAAEWLGKYLEAWWISVGLFVVLAVLLLLNRDKLERSAE